MMLFWGSTKLGSGCPGRSRQAHWKENDFVNNADGLRTSLNSLSQNSDAFFPGVPCNPRKVYIMVPTTISSNDVCIYLPDGL